MEQDKYIVAIDLGTSHLVGMVGRKNAQGKLSILAEEVEVSASCIRRGCVYNVQDTARLIKRLIQKLENRLGSEYRIDKVYIGIGGQSMHAIDHIEVKTISINTAVTQEDIYQLDEQCRAYKPEKWDVLDISSPTYYLDGKKEDNPVGVPCKRIETRYKLIVGQPSIRNHIQSCFQLLNHIQPAGIIVSPLSLAETILSDEEKELGCVLVDFGAGTTSVVIYLHGKLVHLSVIPLGGNLITKDLTSLKLLEGKADKLKKKYGSAIINKEDDNPILSETDGIELRELNTVIEARTIEIVENVYGQVKSSGVLEQLGAGVILAGGASDLNKLQELVQEKFNQKVRFSMIQPEWMESDDERMGNPCYMTAISLLIKGTANCVCFPPQETTQQPTEPKEPKKGKKPKNPEYPPEGGNIFEEFFKRIINPN